MKNLELINDYRKTIKRCADKCYKLIDLNDFNYNQMWLNLTAANNIIIDNYDRNRLDVKRIAEPLKNTIDLLNKKDLKIANKRTTNTINKIKNDLTEIYNNLI